MQQKHQAFAAQVEVQASSAIDQEAAKKSAVHVQSQQKALETLARESVALQVADINAKSDLMVASAQQAQLLVAQKNEQLQAELAEWCASRQPTSHYGDNGGQVDLTVQGQGE